MIQKYRPRFYEKVKGALSRRPLAQVTIYDAEGKPTATFDPSASEMYGTCNWAHSRYLKKRYLNTYKPIKQDDTK